MPTAAEELAQGFRLHQAGQLQQAAQIYRQVLAREPNHGDALHLLGVTALQSNELQAAIEHLQRAVELKPNAGEVQNHLGIAAAKLNRLDEAAVAFRQAARLQPQAADVHFNLANVLRDQGDLDQAIESLQQSLRLRPNYPEAAFNLGNALRARGDLPAAIASFQNALFFKPDYFKARLNLGDVQHESGQWEAATATFHQALTLQPNSAKAHNNLGSVLRSQGQFEEAAASFRRAIALEPEFAEAHYNLGSALLDLKRLDEATGSLNEALRINPKYVKAHNGLAAVYRTQDQIELARASFEQALSLDPKFAEGHTNLACLLQDIGDYAASEAEFQLALSIKPDCVDSHFGLASLRLLQGRLLEGWPEYEWRRKAKSSAARQPNLPLWNGSPLHGRTILLHAEQGLGDTLQFIRYAAIVKQRGGRVTVGCPESLIPLLSNSPGIERLTSQVSLAEGFDYHAPLLSVPGILRTTLETIPADVPYVFPEAERIAHWRNELARHDAFKIGINWQGNPKYPGDRLRSIPLSYFAPLADIPGVRLIALQKGLGREQMPATSRLVDLGPNLDEHAGAFIDTAAIMTCLDLVITSDTATAHLAGALGVPVWVAIPFSPDWRWLLQREDSPWYPTMRLFRQRRPGDWESVFARIALVARRSATRL